MHSTLELARHYKWAVAYIAVAGVALSVAQTVQTFRA
jgi:hypothetical protein